MVIIFAWLTGEKRGRNGLLFAFLTAHSYLVIVLPQRTSLSANGPDCRHFEGSPCHLPSHCSLFKPRVDGGITRAIYNSREIDFIESLGVSHI